MSKGSLRFIGSGMLVTLVYLPSIYLAIKTGHDSLLELLLIFGLLTIWVAIGAKLGR